MFFVIDKPRFERIIAIVREDRTARTQWARGPYMRLEAADRRMALKGPLVEATIPATVYEPGVLFLRITLFRRMLRTIRGQKTLSIQVHRDGLLVDNIRLPLESNDMLLYTDPAAAPTECPLEDPKPPPGEPGAVDEPLPLFDQLREAPDNQTT